MTKILKIRWVVGIMCSGKTSMIEDVIRKASFGFKKADTDVILDKSANHVEPVFDSDDVMNWKLMKATRAVGGSRHDMWAKALANQIRYLEGGFGRVTVCALPWIAERTMEELDRRYNEEVAMCVAKGGIPEDVLEIEYQHSVHFVVTDKRSYTVRAKARSSEHDSFDPDECIRLQHDSFNAMATKYSDVFSFSFNSVLGTSRSWTGLEVDSMEKEDFTKKVNGRGSSLRREEYDMLCDVDRVDKYFTNVSEVDASKLKGLYLNTADSLFCDAYYLTDDKLSLDRLLEDFTQASNVVSELLPIKTTDEKKVLLDALSLRRDVLLRTVKVLEQQLVLMAARKGTSLESFYDR